MAVLTKSERNVLDKAVQAGRAAAEEAAVHEIGRLGVTDDKPPGYLTDDERTLRRDLRAKARQLGDDPDTTKPDLLIGEIAYEQWHRLLFARFLAVNGLLRHPEYGVAVTIDECESLYADFGEPDGWSLAARFASEILPGVFRLTDPCVRVRLAPEDLSKLEALVVGLPDATLLADDALGWVYQFWQTSQKKKVNEAGRKIGGADIAPVTQLFTEDYMVRFLLENSLGAWWAGKHPDSPLLKDWEYLRFLDDGSPAAGTFDQWPPTVAEVTVMDPCCGSGHFLVAAFNMLWRMRVEEEGLSPVQAQDAVIRENLFGLEIDPRCTQIAMFNVVLEAWKQGGYRTLSTPNIGCSGIPSSHDQAIWTSLARLSPTLEPTINAVRDHFENATVLGSLILLGDLTDESNLITMNYSALRSALDGFARDRGPTLVTQDAVRSIAQSSSLLSKSYTLVATNVPYLLRRSMAITLRNHIDSHYGFAKGDLATAFVARCLEMSSSNGSIAAVTPQAWLQRSTYRGMRMRTLGVNSIRLLCRLGTAAFSQISGEVVNVALVVIDRSFDLTSEMMVLDVRSAPSSRSKAEAVARQAFTIVAQASQRENPDLRITGTSLGSRTPLHRYAGSYQGIATGDDPHWRRFFWETALIRPGWRLAQSTTSSSGIYGGCTLAIAFDVVTSPSHVGGATRGREAWNKRGILVNQTGQPRSSVYLGVPYDQNVAAVVPFEERDLGTISMFIRSALFAESLREIDDGLKATNATIAEVPFDIEQWRTLAEEAGPLPEPYSNDPTQWLFKGDPADSTEPLQVAVARLLGYRWPDQEPDDLDDLTDTDGIVCLPAVGGERTAADRLTELLARALGDRWSNTLLDTLITGAGGKPGDLAGWLRDKFFAHHCAVFHQRPFIWHIWDGRPDGFSALVDYHRLDNGTLSKLTFTTLGSWIIRQQAEADDGVRGADLRLASALALQARLKAILEGEDPLDIYVRWKKAEEQAIGWHPDLDDGVRLNIRPFVTALVLRTTPKIKWEKDRGKNPDGSERINDRHLTLAAKRAARERVNP